MTKIKWKNRIKACCEGAGTYQRYFDDTIDTLAWILSERDKLVEQFEESGGEAVVEHTNVKNQINLEQNPIIRLINDFNRDALTYWRDLGLTPKGLKTINEDAMKKQPKDKFSEALKGLGI